MSLDQQTISNWKSAEQLTQWNLFLKIALAGDGAVIGVYSCSLNQALFSTFDAVRNVAGKRIRKSNSHKSSPAEARVISHLFGNGHRWIEYDALTCIARINRIARAEQLAEARLCVSLVWSVASRKSNAPFLQRSTLVTCAIRARFDRSITVNFESSIRSSYWIVFNAFFLIKRRRFAGISSLIEIV